MRVLKEFMALLEADVPRGTLRPYVVQWMIDEYALQGHERPKFIMTSLAGIASTKKHKQVGGLSVDWDIIHAGYSHEKKMIYVNSDAKGDLRQKVIDVLHEIQHFNQQVSWETDKAFRVSFAKGKALPPDIEDDDYDEGEAPPGLFEMSWKRITNFWLMRYRYKRAPHEVDARKFANDHVDEVMEVIQDHLKDPL